jgi:hypothetical protein
MRRVPGTGRRQSLRPEPQSAPIGSTIGARRGVGIPLKVVNDVTEALAGLAFH